MWCGQKKSQISITRASLPKSARTKDFFSENGESLRSSMFYFFILAKQHVGTSIPDQKSNPLPLHWKHEALTTGPSGKS